MKKALLLLILVLIFGCEIQYDGETKLVVKTQLIDSKGNPLSGKSIVIHTSLDYTSDLISNGITASDGQLTLIFPAPIVATINVEISDKDGVYQTKELIHISKKDFINYELNLVPVVLYKKEELTTFTLLLNSVSTTTTTVKNIRIEALKPEEVVDYKPETENQDYPVTQFKIMKNQDFVLKYSTVNYNYPNQITNHSVNLSIGTAPMSYTITF